MMDYATSDWVCGAFEKITDIGVDTLLITQPPARKKEDHRSAVWKHSNVLVCVSIQVNPCSQDYRSASQAAIRVQDHMTSE